MYDTIYMPLFAEQLIKIPTVERLQWSRYNTNLIKKSVTLWLLYIQETEIMSGLKETFMINISS